MIETIRQWRFVRWIYSLLAVLFAFALAFTLSGCTEGASASSAEVPQDPSATNTSDSPVDLSTIPEYTNEAYVEVNNNIPNFSADDYERDAFEEYASLDQLGRCRAAFAMLGRELMPTEGRGDIYWVKPTGWHHSEYDFVDGLSLYNRCHLIAFKLAGENANERNLITGTRYMNTIGMGPFEDEVTNYIYRTGNHVLYRVTPIFDGDNMVAHGVQMEAESVEDFGKGISFNVYCYNVQPGVIINYANGDNWLAEGNEGYYEADSPYAPAG